MGAALSISDPRYNLREIGKQMILLEEHLLVKGKFCPDCISKHLLTIEALADEAQCLDASQRWCHMAATFGQQAKRWAQMYSTGTSPKVIGQEVRRLRKQIAPQILSPGGELVSSALTNPFGALVKTKPRDWMPGVLLVLGAFYLAKRTLA